MLVCFNYCIKFVGNELVTTFHNMNNKNNMNKGVKIIIFVKWDLVIENIVSIKRF